MKFDVTVSVLPVRRMRVTVEAEASGAALSGALQEAKVRAFLSGAGLHGLVIAVLPAQKPQELLMTAPVNESEKEGLNLKAA